MKPTRSIMVFTTVIVTVAAILAGCVSSGSDDPNATTVDAFEGYTSWQKVNRETITGDETGILGRAHEGSDGFREVYINGTGRATSFGQSDFPYPVGTVIVKESYSTSSGEKGSLTGLTIMAKRKAGYDPENGDWEYLNVRPNGRIRAQGALSMCISCHSAAANDFVFTDAR